MRHVAKTIVPNRRGEADLLARGAGEGEVERDLLIRQVQEEQAIAKSTCSNNAARSTLEDCSASICEKAVKSLRSEIRSRKQLERAVLHADSGPVESSPPCNNLNLSV